MTFAWLRRACWLAAALSAGLLAGCGSSTIESALKPTRVIAFGDAFSDLGQGGARYTVNDGTATVWIETFAKAYGKTVTTALTADGVSYATGNARVKLTPDAAAGAAPTIEAQINTFTGGNTFGANDLAVVAGGYSDIIVNVMRVLDATVSVPFGGTITQADALTNISQAGTDMGKLVRRLVKTEGARYVMVAGVYDLSKSPWAIAIGQTSLLSQASLAFNSALLVEIADLGANVYYADTAAYFNSMVSSPGSVGLSTVTVAACNPATASDAGNGIGTGTGKLNSALCTDSTILPGQDYKKYLFADQVYPTPAGHAAWGARAAALLRTRW